MPDSAKFDLSSFDPSTIDLSHLHPAEQDRIRRREFNERELSLLLTRQNPWTKSGKPKPLPTTIESDRRPSDLGSQARLLDEAVARITGRDVWLRTSSPGEPATQKSEPPDTIYP